ncbi:MAG TPA: hypothetical protein PKE55_02815 [Kiritimatiellia bacterium]|nr:hypothetical protein [Kiritimatiellia bacterium]
MKRITLICLASDREKTVRRLCDLGVVHVTNLRPPESRDLEISRGHLGQIKRALDILPASTHAKPTGLHADTVVSLIWTLIQEKNELEDRLEVLSQEHIRLAPFGNFEPEALGVLSRHGVEVRFFHLPPKAEPKAPAGWVLVETSRTKTRTSVALVGSGPLEFSGTEVKPGDRSLRSIEEEQRELQAQLQEIEQAIMAYAGDRPSLAGIVRDVEERVQFLETRDGMGATAPIAYLRGFAPEDAEPALLEAARTHGWGVRVEDPDPSEDVPTLIRNPRWVEPIRAVFEGINILPGYREVDIGAAFLVFFSIFFAMIIGDAGYGLIFLAATLWGWKKNPQAPRYIFHLLLLTSSATILWGTLTGTWFGAARLPGLLEAAKVGWLQFDDNLMRMCFLIGAVHLTIAHVWNSIRLGVSPAVLGQIGWIGTTWTMYFAARNMIVNDPWPPFIGWIFLTSVILIVLFMTPVRKLKTEWLNHVMLPLNLISNFVDVVSYIRLFAVGTATYAVASAFNEMALGAGINSVLTGLLAAVILLFGHTLNILLGAMGVLVHGVRLNTLEFSSHLGLQWSGFPYRPFAHRPIPPGS